MATNALTHCAQRASRDIAHRSQDPNDERGWRELFNNQDAEAVWQKIFFLLTSVISDNDSNYEQITQDLFLRLLSTERIKLYMEQGYSDDEIRDDLLLLMSA